MSSSVRFSAAPFAATESSTTPAADVALTKQALDLARRGKTSDATTIQQTISDPLARKLVEWTILRSDENDAGFSRFAAFISENPSWPNATMMRRRAESALWDERRSAETLRAFFASSKPITAKGKFALARALLAAGDTPAAAQLVRQAWREDTCSAAVERAVMDTFGDMVTRADHKARMDRRFYDDEPDAGMRMAQLLGGTDLLIGRARKAVSDKASNARALLDAVPESASGDAGYLFHKAQWLRREDKPVEAARLLQAAPRSASQQHNLEEWWTERRLVARKLLDEGKKKILLNLGDVSYVDSSGIGELVSSYTTTNNNGGQLKLLNLTKKIQDLLLITKLLTVFQTFDNEQVAVESFD